MRIILLSISFLFISVVKAEVVSTDEMMKVISKIEEAYKKYDSYSMDVQHRSYVGDKTGTPFETSKGYYIKSKNFMESDLLGVHTIQNDKFTLTVNPNMRMGILSDNQKQEAIDPESIKAYLEDVENIEKTKQGNVYEYTFSYKDGAPLEYFKFKLDSKFFIKRITYLYATEMSQGKADGSVLKGKPKVEIIYSNILTSGVKDISGVMNQYLQANGKSYRLIGKYANYDFSDNRIKK